MVRHGLPKREKKGESPVWSTRLKREAHEKMAQLQAHSVDVPKLVQACIYECLERAAKEAGV